MNVLFTTNLPSPYRVKFFNELGKKCKLTVCYERKQASDRDEKWKGECAKNFQEVYLDLKPKGTEGSKGRALQKFIKNAKFDILILTNYASPAVMRGILYCRLHKIPFMLEYDGGIYKKDAFLKGILKKFLIRGAKYHLTTSDEHIKYLKSIGIKEEKIFKYPFTSLTEKDIEKGRPISADEKQKLKEKLCIKEEKVVLSVGRFTYDGGYGKGYDTLLKVASQLREIGFYIVGGAPNKEFLRMKKQMELENVYFIDFKEKEALAIYYQVADVFVLLTRGDVWGLVINEAMAYGLPIVTTNACVAGLELVKEGENGFLTDAEDACNATAKTAFVLRDEKVREAYSRKSKELIQGYTIEKMAERHIEIFEKIKND